MSTLRSEFATDGVLVLPCPFWQADNLRIAVQERLQALVEEHVGAGVVEEVLASSGDDASTVPCTASGASSNLGSLGAVVEEEGELAQDRGEEEPVVVSMLRCFVQDSYFQSIARERRQVDEVLSFAEDEEGWKEVRNSDGIRVTYRPGIKKGTQMLRMQGEIEASAVDVVAALYEVDTWSEVPLFYYSHF